jgi:hypothetical protein
MGSCLFTARYPTTSNAWKASTSTAPSSNIFMSRPFLGLPSLRWLAFLPL